ncbi:hypothetical protein DFS34DRAFT_23571 [Phlyctochytrium arcticum]|nr:hypothetical protein DFS34DRAFT_23571 [Phlyctochytrium arcticum]
MLQLSPEVCRLLLGQIMLFATRRDPGCINDFSEFPGGTAKVGRMKLLMGKERLDVSENEKSMARPMRLFPSLLPLARGPHLHLLESTSGAKLLCGRVALPEETLLPRLRRMDPTSLRSTGSEVPSEKLVFKKGISTFIDRGFAPSSGDFSRIMGADIPEKGRSLRSGLKILEKNPAQSGDKEDKSDILAPKPFFKHQAVELQPPDRRQHRLDHYLVPALGQYEQHLRLASAAEWLKDSVEQAVGLKVNRSRAIHKETISTVAPRPKNRRPSLQSRCVARTILPPPRLPQEEEHYVASLQANTPAPSHIASASESSTRSGSEVNLFVAETVRTATAKAIAASRRGAIMPIIDGELQQQSSTYQSFREKAGPARWGKVEWILEQIQNLCMEFAVPYADIMCEAVLDLTVPETRTQVSRDELASCAVNSVEVYLLVHAAGQRYRGRDGKQAAATKIQATFRMWIMRRIHVWYLDRVWATNVFIKHWNRRKLRFSHRRKSNAQYITVHLKRYQRLQSTLKRTFDSLMSRKRVIIQLVPSKQLGDLNQFPDVSVGRTILLSNPDVELVFVTPYLDEDRIKYYTRIIGAGFPERNPMDQNRLNFVIPEAARCFPSTAPIAAALIASQRALNRLKKICTGKNAIFMCDIVGEAEVTLSSTLSIPIFGPTPDAYAQHLSTRSRAREFLKSCQVPVAPALEVHARSEDELSLHIVKAISMFSEVPVWTLHRDPFIRKLDGTERDGPDAYVDAGLLTFVQKLWEPLARKTYAVSDRPSTSQMEIHNVSEAPSSSSDAGVFRPMTAPALHDLERPMTPRRGMIAAHLTIAQREIPLHVRMVAAGVSWSDMLKAWRRSGGLVQGFPTKDARDTTLIEIGIMLGFDGQFQVIVMSEALLQRASFSPSILIIPQSQTWGDIKQGLSTHLPAITAQCASRGIVGLLSLQFWRWKDPTTNKLKFWATSIRPHLTPNLLRAATVLLATGCRTDSSDWNAKFFLKDVPMRIRHAGNVRWIDQGKVQDAFHHKRVPNISIHEPRVAVYLFGLEHGQVALMTQAAAVAVASNNGLGYDEMTRMGNLFPHKDATWQGGFPMVIVGARYDKVLENSLTSLLRFKKLFDEVARVSGARYRSNFMVRSQLNLRRLSFFLTFYSVNRHKIVI